MEHYIIMALCAVAGFVAGRVALKAFGNMLLGGRFFK